MTRFERKFRKDIKLAINTPNVKNGMTALIDDYFKTLWRINDNEYDWLIEKLSDDDELNKIILNEKSTIGEMKIAITLVNEMLEIYNNRIREERNDKINKLI